MTAPGLITIEFPEAIRSRKVVTRSRARPTGKFPSWKMGRMLQWESVGELNAMRLLDADHSVHSFAEQPAVVRYALNGETRIHYPDLLVTREGGLKEFWEVKPEKEAAREEVAARTALLRAALPTLGYQYRLVHGEELRRQPRLSNVLEILKWGRGPITAVERERIRALLTRVPAVTWGAAASGGLGRSGRQVLCRLVLEGLVAFDVNEKVCLDTPFTLSRLRCAP
jgi:hypothetical protein